MPVVSDGKFSVHARELEANEAPINQVVLTSLVIV